MQMRVITTVTAPAASYDLTTLAVVKDELAITTGASDTTLKRYLSWASAALAQECNRVFVQETVQDQMWPARMPFAFMDVLQLARWPVSSVASLTENGSVFVADIDFVVNGAVGQVLRLDSDGNIRPWNTAPKIVSYVAGYPTIPGDLQDATTRMVRNRFRAKGRDSFLMSENIPGVRDSRWWIATGNEAGNVPPDIADLIGSYRVPVVA